MGGRGCLRCEEAKPADAGFVVIFEQIAIVFTGWVAS